MSYEDSAPPPLPQHSDSGLAIAALVLGILSLMMCIFGLGLIFGLIGIVLGLVHYTRRGASRVMAGWGIGLSAFGSLASLFFVAAYAYLFMEIVPMIDLEGMLEEETFAEWEGVRAPDFSVTTLEGETLALSDLRGKRVVVDMWATWCPPCVQEIPHFIDLADEIPESDLAIVGISDEDEATIRDFAGDMGINYALAANDRMPSPYGDVVSIPTTFIIDRNGVIQQVLVGYHDKADLLAAATAPDFAGEPLDEPRLPPDDLIPAENPVVPVQRWSAQVAGAEGLCTGDWNGDGVAEILVSGGEPALHVFSQAGEKLDSIPIPLDYALMEVGQHPDGPRLLGHENWGNAITVLGADGSVYWEYSSWMGTNGAHWGDRDGDGVDEMIVGMNGAGGLHLVSSTGDRIWKKRLGNVWNQTIVRTAGGQVRILATEAGGGIWVFDGEGKKIDVHRPRGDYFSDLMAVAVDGGETIHVLARGVEHLVSLELDGNVLWRVPVPEDHGSWRKVSMASGDVNADGMKDWAFVGYGDSIYLASAAGERLAEMPGQKGVTSFAFADNLFVTLASDSVTAYGFEPLAPSEEPPETAPEIEPESAPDTESTDPATPVPN